MSLQALKDNLAGEVHGMSLTEAQQQRICINCKKPIRACTRAHSRPGGIYSSAGVAEYRMSGLCEFCFDAITANPQ